MDQIKIFVSYSHRDAAHLEVEGLIGFLQGLERDSAAKFWIDNSLLGGDRWDDVIQAELAGSHIALLLVSQAFLDSHYCLNVEVSSFLDRQRRAGLRIFPVLLSACEWERHAWLAQYQMLPGANETLEEDYCEPGKQKRMYLRIRKELRKLIEEVSAALHQAPPARQPEVNAELRTVTLLQCSLSVDRQKYGLDAGEQLEFLYEAAPLFKERCLSEIELLNGYVVTMSDAGQVLVCFGYPETQELDSVKAVRAGLAILRATAQLNQKLYADWNARLTVRAGVHTGLVIGKTGADAQQQFEHGQTSALTNLAMKEAPADGLVITQPTHNRVEGFFGVVPHRSIAEADTQAVIPLYQVTADLGINTRFEARKVRERIPLVGRQQEMALLLDRWQKARAGHGQLVAVASEAGLGKSRLVQEAKREFVRQGSPVFGCQCSVFTTNSPLFPLIAPLKRWLGFKETDTDADKLAKVEAVARGFGLPPAEVVPYFAELLLIAHPGAEAMARLNPKQLRDGMLEAVLSMLIQSATQVPLAIIVEDLHWVDSSTLDCLLLLFGELPSTAICLVVSARPEFSMPAAWQAENYFSLIKLDQLDRADTAAMVARLTNNRALPREVFEAICQKTEGYPLFIEELTRMVLSSGVLQEQEGRYVLAQPFAALAIPDTLHEALMVRLQKLEGGRIIAQIGAVLGREFSVELLKAIAPLPEDKLKEVLARLLDSGLFYRRGLLSKSVYIFKHALVQDALYESLLRKERKRYHKQAATVLEAAADPAPPELLGYHYERAGYAEKAAAYYEAAGQRTLRVSACREAATLLQKALAALDFEDANPTDHRATKLRLVSMLAAALTPIEGWAGPNVIATYERARALATGPGAGLEAAPAIYGLWIKHMVFLELPQADELAREYLRLGQAHEDVNTIIHAHNALINTYFWRGDLAQTHDHARQVLALYPASDPANFIALFGHDPRVMSHLFLIIGGALRGQVAEAEAQLVALLALAESLHHPFSEVIAIQCGAWLSFHLEDVPRTLHYSEQLIARCQQHGFTFYQGVGEMFRAYALLHTAQPAEALALLEVGYHQHLLESGGRIFQSVYGWIKALALRHAHDPAAALQVLDETLAVSEATQERCYHAHLLALKAQVLMALGRAAEGQAAAAQATAEAAAQGVQLPRFGQA